MAALRDEEFDGEEADDPEFLQNAAGEFYGFLREVRADGGGGEGHVEDVVGVAVLEDGEGGELPVRRARGDDGDFLFEVHESL